MGFIFPLFLIYVPALFNLCGWEGVGGMGTPFYDWKSLGISERDWD